MSTKAKQHKELLSHGHAISVIEVRDATIASIRAQVKKLRKELGIARAENDISEGLAENYQAEAETWRTAHQQLAAALAKGGR
jgi:hypothetical protein